MSKLKIAVIFIFVALFLSFGFHAAWAQIAGAEIRGKVVDTSGAILPGVTITITHVETGTSRTVVTSDRGTYFVPALEVGTFNIKAEIEGFAPETLEGMVLAVGQKAVVDFTLKIGGLEEAITVTAEAPLIETTKSDIGGSVNPTQVKHLPLNGRNWLDLATVVPGVRSEGGTPLSGAQGSRRVQVNVDAMDVSDQ